MPKKEDKERKKLVVEEVEAPVTEEVVSSTDIEKSSPVEANSITGVPDGQVKGEIPEEAASTEEAEKPSEEMEKEIHQEEGRLHDIHTGVAPAQEIEKKSGNPIWWILIPGIFLLGALLGGIVFYIKGVNSTAATPTPSPSAVVTQSPSPSPVSKADLAKYAIKIENGSGIPGAAGTAKDLLVKAGFSVSGTGNADTYDFTDTIIEAKSDVPAGFVTLLKTTLQSTYSVGKNVILKDSSADEVVVIIGSSKAQ